MKRTLLLTLISLLLGVIMPGCRSTYNINRMDPLELQTEGTIVFVRPTKYWPFIGTKSIRDYVKLTHEDVTRNEAGLLQISIGLRDVGGTHFWDLKGKDFPLSLKTVFYDQPYAPGGTRGVPIYETNWQTIKLLRGATTEYKVLCPKKEGTHYQVTISELLY